MRTAVIITFIAGFFLLFKGSPVFATTLNVCPSGCSFTTISQAETAASPGDTVIVSNGTYNGFTVTKQITIAAQNYDQANPKNNPTRINGQVYIQGTNWAWDKGPIIRGFHIVGLDPVRGKQTPYTLEYSFIEASGQGSDGVSFESAGGIIRGNHVEPAGDDCIDVDSQTTDILIENNYLKNCNQDGVEVRQQPNTIAQRVTLTMRNNRIEATGQDGLQIMDYANFTNRRYILERNLFIGIGSKSSGAGIGIMEADVTTENFSAAAMPEPLYAINNTFVNGDAGISGGANVIAINNIFSGNSVFDLKNVSGNSKVSHSLFSSAPKLQGINNIVSSTTKTANPLLDANYRLQTGSPAIDAGLAQYQHTYNYNGSGGGSAQTYTEYAINLARSQYAGNAPDIGAFESNMTGPSPTFPPPSTPSPTPYNPTITLGASPTSSSALGCRTNPARLTCFEAWRSSFTSGIFSNDADMNNSNTVTIADFEVWRRAYTGI